ncbi:LysM peptidoglycan-binding domain-containing protein [Neobacillus thermocopriae]|uniref:LysM peptidoglycan-binding domain-containing protein n=1 Tax=Neobacillus thermocopriae TaxID=1215031 RepID=A0A6B3TUC8_9BACI|nr:LysM peptidoglycan-binding domain-containing protein [Neobacillus thermocopriae]MED3624883.1 LysM peptidoglycan-binding domain-containing protein [Neobacillus thermocopriae]MED3713938.1 LysM peptidoglycan-binding domain-containing protein [Neobacillus thermocopriae]NEX79936.1 LysM peptidoglycan-binding domain-containing protein [Neobacillus thermocopriae]
MNKEEPYREQADRLKQPIEKMNNTQDIYKELPPREQRHREKKKKTKWKIKYPVIRLLVLLFILLPVIIFSVITYLDEKRIPVAKKTSGDSIGYETINLKNVSSDEQLEENEQESIVETINEIEQSQTKHEDKLPVIETDNIELTDKNETVENHAGIRNSTVAGSNKENKNNETHGANSEEDSSNHTKNEKIIYHKVQQQETLFRIAMKYYHSQKGIEIIKRANHLNNEEIYVGQVLKIPLD